MRPIILILALIGAAPASAEAERYRFDDDERAALVNAARSGLAESLEVHRTRGRIEGPQISALVDFLPAERENDIAAYFAVECEKRGYAGAWTCSEPQRRHEINVDGDVLRLASGIEVAEGFEVARLVKVLYLTDGEALRTDAALNGVVGKDELREIVKIEPTEQGYAVALVGQPLAYNILQIERVKCGGFATCGLALAGVTTARYLELPRDFPQPPPPRPTFDEGAR